MGKLTYLACPYQHADKQVMRERFDAVNRAAAQLMREGVYVFSPISHTHPIAECGDLPRGWDYWEAYDRALLSCCSKLIVLQLPGWEQSVGVQAETAIARELGLDIEYWDGLALTHPTPAREGA